MTITSASQGASATPATDAYNTLAALMTTWSFVETVPLATAGTTADVKVWRNSTRGVVLMIEPDDTNARIRFRVSEEFNKVQTITLTSGAAGNSFKQTYLGVQSIAFVIGTNCTAAAIQAALRTLTGDATLTVTGTTDTGAFTVTFTAGFHNSELTASSVTGGTLGVVDTYDHKMQYACPGNASNSVMTPTANDAVDASPLTIFQAAAATSKGGYMNIPVSSGGFGYVVGANDDEIIFATNTSQINWVHAGRFRAADNFTPASSMVFLGGRHTGTGTNGSWTSDGTNTGNYRVSREPNQGANGISGAFAYVGATPSPDEMLLDGMGGEPGVAHKWLANMATYPMYLHCASGTGGTVKIRTHLARMASLQVFGHDTVAVTNASMSLGDTITIDGDTYYLLGPTVIVWTNAGVPQWQCRIACAKSSAF